MGRLMLDISRMTLALILFVIVYGFGSTTVSAAEQRQIRLGDDYSFLRQPPGTNFTWCEESCRNDPRCKSWTFIKNIRQCRLKHSVAPAFKNDCCVSGVRPTNQRVSRQSLCADYARTAVEQNDLNLLNRCGYGGSRWSAQYKDHYRWCVSVGRKARRTERVTRERALSKCEANKRTLDPKCHTYAQYAVQQNKANLRNRCGFTRKSRWSSEYKFHYDSCVRKGHSAIKDETKARKTHLATCVARGGGPNNKECNDYTKAALNQVKTGEDNVCGFGGPQWSKEAKVHYQRCLKIGNWERKAEADDRDRAIKHCLAQRGGSEIGRLACDHYARLSAVQTDTNKKLNCGLVGGGWRQGYDAHNKRCLSLSRTQRDTTIRQREDELDACIERGGGPFEERCHNYAQRSIKQYKKMVNRDCSLRGRHWHDRYADHYQWCLSAPRRRLQRVKLRKKVALETCRIGGVDVRDLFRF